MKKMKFKPKVFLWSFINLLLLLPLSILFHCWLSFFRGMSTNQVLLNLGANCFSRGAGLKLNEQVKVVDGKRGDELIYKKKYVVNMLYDFRKNEIKPRYSSLPLADRDKVITYNSKNPHQEL